jgi:hypothetical protein
VLFWARQLFHFGPDLGHLGFRRPLADLRCHLLLEQALGNPDQPGDRIVMLGQGFVDPLHIAIESGLMLDDERDISLDLFLCHLRQHDSFRHGFHRQP